MKFKFIFILFNVLIIGAFLILFFMPVFLIGWDFAGSMWRQTWYLPILFFLFIGILNYYFILNWRLFSLLEQEKWGELLDFLDDEFFMKSRGKRGIRLNRSRVRIYINGCIATTSINRIDILADFLKKKQPKLYAEFLLTLGLPRLLNEEPAELEEHYSQVFDLSGVKLRPWCILLYSFALLLQRKEGASEHMAGLLTENDLLMTLLALYFLHLAGEDEGADGGEVNLLSKKITYIWF